MEANSVSDTSETNLVIITKRDRIFLFCTVYWRILIILFTPLILLPVAFLGKDTAYPSFYIFLITSIYWLTDAIHPTVISMIPVAFYTFMPIENSELTNEFTSQIYIRNCVMNSLGMMIIIVAIEYSNIHRRIGLKMLIVFGCSHYRLSFLLFLFSMFLSLWVSNTVACGLMMPIVKAILSDLEKMGILEVYHIIGKARQRSNRHEQNTPRPTDFTVFYFLGIAYSASIGGMATLVGSHTNIIYKQNYESIFPVGPKIEYPHFMLLNLPGVLLMEVLLYLWMNFSFLGMFRAQSEIALEIGLTEEEAQYIQTLLSTQYQQLGKITFHEVVVAIVVTLVVLLQSTTGIVRSINMSSHTILCVVILFIAPTNYNFIKFFKRHFDLRDEQPLPNSPSKGCLNWNLVRSNITWSVLFVVGGSCTIFYTLAASRMTEEFEKFLMIFGRWPAPAFALVIIVFCKVMSEFGSNSCVVYSLLPHIARLSVIRKINPHYLMLSATLSSSIPFHLITGTPANAMVAGYVHIPPWKMMYTGLGPSIIGIVVIWFTVTLWSKAIWTDINLYPSWADVNIFNITY